MTRIPSKDERKALNIDTYERAIVYSALLLRSALVDDALELLDPKGELANRLTFDLITNLTTDANNNYVVEAFLKIQASFNYLNLPAYVGGGDFFRWIAPYGEGYAMAWDSAPIPPTEDNSDPFPEELPSAVITLEQFFFWSVEQLYLKWLNEKSDYLNNINFDLRDAATDAKIAISISIQIDFKSYLKNNNLVAACTKIASHDPIPTPLPSIFGNQTLIGDASLVGN